MLTHLAFPEFTSFFDKDYSLKDRLYSVMDTDDLERLLRQAV